MLASSFGVRILALGLAYPAFHLSKLGIALSTRAASAARLFFLRVPAVLSDILKLVHDGREMAS